MARAMAKAERGQHEFRHDCRMAVMALVAFAATCVATGNVPW